jgi:glycosyltransferase involved in cell wall biosynthesis
MNILFVGPYRQKDGWGLAARDYIKAISTVSNINLATRCVYTAMAYSDENFSDSEILLYEKNCLSNYDMIIQNVLPEDLFYDSRFKKNIGLFTLEINDLSKTDVIRNIDRMDEIWVPSKIEKKSLVESGINSNKIKVISEALDLQQISPSNRIIFDSEIEHSFKFYTIGEFVYRKNLEDLIMAFHLEFDLSDNVSLIIKTGNNVSDTKIFSEKIKKKLQLNKQYRPELFISKRLSYQEIIDFHYSCDCFVSASYGEAFCRPAAEALCLGKNPIVNKNTGMADFINEENGFLVKSYKTPVLLENNPINNNNDYYNANQYWYKIDVYDLMNKMRTAYEMYKKDKVLWDQKSELGISQKQIFSYENIGKKLCIQPIR